MMANNKNNMVDKPSNSIFRQLRREAGISQKQFAQLLGLKGTTVLCSIERHGKLTVDQLIFYDLLFDATLEELLAERYCANAEILRDRLGKLPQSNFLSRRFYVLSHSRIDLCLSNTKLLSKNNKKDV